MTDKHYVGMSICFLCGEPKAVLLDRRLKNSLVRSAVYDQEPCDKCKKHMKQGIILISADPDSPDQKNPYRTGGFVVVKEEAIVRILGPGEFLDSVLKERVAFVPDDIWKFLGLPEIPSHN